MIFLFQCVMASTVIIALDGLFGQIFTVPDLWYNRRPDFVRFVELTKQYFDDVTDFSQTN